MKKPEGVVVIAVYYLIVALIFLIGSCALLVALVAAVTSIGEPVGTTGAAIILGGGLFVCLIFLIGSAMAGWGLLKLNDWGRWAALVLGVLQLPGFPILTIIGGFIIYYLLREDVVAAFNGAPAEAVALPDEVFEDATE